MGIHTWNKETEKPEAYVLGYSLISSGSGKDQATADFHIISKQFGINNVGAMIEDNAKTQTGNKWRLVKINSTLFNKQMYTVGCYPHVLNIVVRRSCQAAFGSKGDMTNKHVQQLHHKIALVHHEKPDFYQSMYKTLEILEKPPPLPPKLKLVHLYQQQISINQDKRYTNSILKASLFQFYFVLFKILPIKNIPSRHFESVHLCHQ